jgi:hypothetical protein
MSTWPTFGRGRDDRRSISFCAASRRTQIHAAESVSVPESRGGTP